MMKLYKGSENWNKGKLEHWTDLLGQEILKKMLMHSPRIREFFLEMARGRDETFWNDEIESLSLDLKEENMLDDITFSSFYVPLSAYAVMMLREQLLDKSDCYAESVFEDFQKTCVNQLQAICVRTMILRMHEQKQAGNLFGDTATEEYMDFNARILNSTEFIQDTFRQFPELYRCVTELLEDVVVYYAEIIANYQHEYDDIKHVLQIPDGEIKIIHIETGLGDGHNRGRQVVKITLEEGTSFLYKPHSMENDEAYYKLLSWLEKSIYISQKYVPLVSYKDHGWCGIVPSDTCKTKQELKQYYERFGVQLFLTWILGTRDLHFENVIASGAYPVMVDLEVLLSANDNKAKTMQDAVLMELSKSVLFSGLLPYYHWNKEGEGIDGSALSGKDGQVYPFKIPTIVDDKTSNMRVEYIHPVTHAAKNLATLHGEFVSPARYETQILRGFMRAYQAVAVDKDAFLQEAELLQKVRIRYLVADTQRYSMLLNSSYHPSLLRDPIEREIFLHAIWMGRDDAEAPMVACEVQSMVHGDIPLFYCNANECALCADSEVIVKDYFSKSAYQMFVDRIKTLNVSEIEKQQDSISLALRMINDGEYRYLNKIYSVLETDREFDFTKTITKKREELLARILKYAVWNDARTEVGWYTVHMGEGEHMTWSLAPMDMYLYDGLAGMLLIFESIQLQGACGDVSEYVKVLRQMLFHYTEQGIKEPGSLNSIMTGAFEGEGSVLHTYLLLYYMTGIQEYLEYAKKHAQIVIGLLEKDTRYDMLAGNAGAAQILLWLYSMTDDDVFLDGAKYAIELLTLSAIKQEKGVGWITDTSTPPMSGMAHGNAGILMPVMWLWSITQDSKYEELAEEIWQYENSLYNMNSENWDDLRAELSMEDPVGAVAWCHGAPGILLSRIFCYRVTTDETWKQRFYPEIYIAYKKLKQYWKRDSWSLCHGNCGNLWILELAEQYFAEEGIVAQMEDFVAEKMKRSCMKEAMGYLPQELLNPGLMNGYGGVVMWALMITGY